MTVGFVARRRRKLLKVVVSCFMSRLLRFQKLPRFVEVDIFGRCQVVKLSSSSETREIWTEIKYFENIWTFGLLHEFVLRAGRLDLTQRRDVAKTRKGSEEVLSFDLGSP
jgi:hypothetical protein